MPNIKSQKDRVRQAAKEAAHNKAIKTNLKTVVKKAEAAVSSGAADAETLSRAAVSAIDKAANKGVLHKNTAASPRFQGHACEEGLIDDQNQKELPHCGGSFFVFFQLGGDRRWGSFGSARAPLCRSSPAPARGDFRSCLPNGLPCLRTAPSAPAAPLYAAHPAAAASAAFRGGAWGPAAQARAADRSRAGRLSSGPCCGPRARRITPQTRLAAMPPAAAEKPPVSAPSRRGAPPRRRPPAQQVAKAEQRHRRPRAGKLRQRPVPPQRRQRHPADHKEYQDPRRGQVGQVDQQLAITQSARRPKTPKNNAKQSSAFLFYPFYPC